MTDPFRPLKDAFGRFATGVAVATCAASERNGADAGAGSGALDSTAGFVALTVNSFSSVSLDPPLVLWCIDAAASSFDAFMAADGYGISVLREDQQDVSQRFASRGAAPLTRAEVDIWTTGAPILRDRLAGFDCETVARHRAGDHVVLVGRVVRFDSGEGAPLVYFASAYRSGLQL